MIMYDDILRVSRCIENRGNSSNPLGRLITRVGSVGVIASRELFRVVDAIARLEGADCVVQRLEESIRVTIHTKKRRYCLSIDKGLLYCHRLFTLHFLAFKSNDKQIR